MSVASAVQMRQPVPTTLSTQSTPYEESLFISDTFLNMAFCVEMHAVYASCRKHTMTLSLYDGNKTTRVRCLPFETLRALLKDVDLTALRSDIAKSAPLSEAFRRVVTRNELRLARFCIRAVRRAPFLRDPLVRATLPPQTMAQLGCVWLMDARLYVSFGVNHTTHVMLVHDLAAWRDRESETRAIFMPSFNLLSLGRMQSANTNAPCPCNKPGCTQKIPTATPIFLADQQYDAYMREMVDASPAPCPIYVKQVAEAPPPKPLPDYPSPDAATTSETASETPSESTTTTTTAPPPPNTSAPEPTGGMVFINFDRRNANTLGETVVTVSSSTATSEKTTSFTIPDDSMMATVLQAVNAVKQQLSTTTSRTSANLNATVLAAVAPTASAPTMSAPTASAPIAASTPTESTQTAATTTTPALSKSPSPKERTCALCGAVTTTAQRCGRCRSVYYCSESCQRQAWSEHRANCTAV